MKTLLVVRHAKSSWKNEGQRDFERPLNARGRRDAPRMGQRIAARGFAPDLIVSSPATRARCTAQLLARQIGFPEERIALDERIYEAHAARLVQVLRDLEERGRQAMLVGHNPGVTDLVGLLTGRFLASLPTCGVVDVALAVDAWREVGEGSGSLAGFDAPKRLPS